MKSLIIVLMIAVTASGCATTTVVTHPSKTGALQPGMTKEEVINLLGKPMRTGAKVDKSGKTIEAFLYEDAKQWDWWSGDRNTDYLKVYFVDGRVYQFGANEDWKRDEMDINLNVNN